MSEYIFETVWTIDAPIEAVWDAIVASERWPEWWPYLESVVEVAPGDSAGMGAILGYTWRGPLPYRLTFEVTVTKMERPVLLEGEARGDLKGVGRTLLSERGRHATRVRYIWQVKTTKPWMNVLAPLARGLFTWNHDLVMKAGGAGLAGHLGKSWKFQTERGVQDCRDTADLEKAGLEELDKKRS